MDICWSNKQQYYHFSDPNGAKVHFMRPLPDVDGLHRTLCGYVVDAYWDNSIYEEQYHWYNLCRRCEKIMAKDEIKEEEPAVLYLVKKSTYSIPESPVACIQAVKVVRYTDKSFWLPHPYKISGAPRRYARETSSESWCATIDEAVSVALAHYKEQLERINNNLEHYRRNQQAVASLIEALNTNPVFDSR